MIGTTGYNGTNQGNLGNLGLLFHEFLHNFYGLQDPDMLIRLQLFPPPSCKINKHIQNEVLLGVPVPNTPNLVGTEIKMTCAQ
jgi:hypothetical protein